MNYHISFTKVVINCDAVETVDNACRILASVGSVPAYLKRPQAPLGLGSGLGLGFVGVVDGPPMGSVVF